MLTRRKVIGYGAATAASATLPAWAQTSAEIVVGGSLPLTGVFAFAGVSIHNGIQDYVKVINESGGVAGRKIRYVAEDTGYKVDTSVAVFNKLVSQEKLNFYYGDSTGFSKTINGELERNGNILMGGTSFASELNDPKKYPFQFMSGPDYAEMYGILFEYIAKEKPGARLAFVNSDTEFGRDPIALGEAKAAKLGLQVVEKILTPPGSVDVSTDVLKLRRANPDYTIFHGYVAAPIPEFVTQAKQIGLQSKFMGTFWSMDNSIVQKMGEAADGFLGVMPYRYYFDTDGPSPMLAKIRQLRPEYQTTYYTQGFLTTMLFCEAARRALEAKKELTGANLKLALNSIKDFDTGGIVGVPISIPGNSIPVGRIYRFDGAKKTMVPASEWIRLA